MPMLLFVSATATQSDTLTRTAERNDAVTAVTRLERLARRKPDERSEIGHPDRTVGTP